MSATDIAQLLSAMAAIGAFVAAAVQVSGWRKDALATRAGEIEGVTLETDVVDRPVKADAGDGQSRWKYRFTVHNPGRFLSARSRFGSTSRSQYGESIMTASSTRHGTTSR
jgi:hypothetical protein